MSTNYYRLLPETEVEERTERLSDSLKCVNFNTRLLFNNEKTPWDEFFDDLSVHLGKREYKWKFLWNFHDNKYYSNKEELMAFIKSGIIVDEYGDEIPCDEFIDMSLNWFKDDGWDSNTYHKHNKNDLSFEERYIDDLRVSNFIEFF